MSIGTTALSPLIAKAEDISRTESTVSRKSVILDLLERAIVVAMFCRFMYVTIGDFAATAHIASLLIFIGESLMFVLIIVRKRSATLSQRPTDWLFAIAGTTFALLITPASVAPLVPIGVCIVVMVSGIFIQVSAKIALGRSFGIVAANRGVKTHGPYRFVRHPMYAGYTITHVGFLLAMPSLTNALLYAIELCLQLIRIAREERVLNQSEDYRTFAASVRYRLLPGVY